MFARWWCRDGSGGREDKMGKGTGAGKLVTQNCLIVRVLGFQKKSGVEVRVGF